MTPWRRWIIVLTACFGAQLALPLAFADEDQRAAAQRRFASGE